MPYIILGTTDQLQIKVPTNASTNWGNVMKSDTFQKIAEHDHSGSSKGSQLGTGSILDNAIIGSKLRLNNNEYVRARNFALDADVNILKINTSDKVEFGTDIEVISLVNNVALKSRNAADDGYIDLIKLDSNDKVSLSLASIGYQGSVSLLDDTTTTDAGIITLAADETSKILGKIKRDTDVCSFELSLNESDQSITEKRDTDDDFGITFDVVAGTLIYSTTSTGQDATVTFTLFRG